MRARAQCRHFFAPTTPSAAASRNGSAPDTALYDNSPSPSHLLPRPAKGPANSKLVRRLRFRSNAFHKSPVLLPRDPHRPAVERYPGLLAKPVTDSVAVACSRVRGCRLLAGVIPFEFPMPEKLT